MFVICFFFTVVFCGLEFYLGVDMGGGGVGRGGGLGVGSWEGWGVRRVGVCEGNKIIVVVSGVL